MAMSDGEFEYQLGIQVWKFAKTYAKKSPHEYFLQKNNEGLFQEVMRRVRDLGETEMYYKTKFRVYHFQDFKYWGYDDGAGLVNRTRSNKEECISYYADQIREAISSVKQR